MPIRDTDCKHLKWVSLPQTVFPGGAEVKASACNVGDLGSIPGSGRSPGEGNGNTLPYSCLENPMDRGAWWATVHGSQRVGHDWATSLFFSPQTVTLCVLSMSVLGHLVWFPKATVWTLPKIDRVIKAKKLRRKGHQKNNGSRRLGSRVKNCCSLSHPLMSHFVTHLKGSESEDHTQS